MKREKVSVTEFNDKWLFDNGFFKYAPSRKREGYNIVIVSEEWRKIFENAFKRTTKVITVNDREYINYKMVTPELLVELLNSKKLHRLRVSKLDIYFNNMRKW